MVSEYTSVETFRLSSILNRISQIREKYKESSFLLGENYNIFKVLKLETNEVRTHSAFLADLLNPKSAHGYQELFLTLFVEELGIRDFDCDKAQVVPEKHIGYKTEKHGGRIDIYICSNNGRRILVENKIYAKDQDNQLLRYHNYDKNAEVVYLTLDGRQPAEAEGETRTLPESCSLRVASYSKNVISWLQKCRKEVVTHPVLRETITQYINLIKYLTSQTSDEHMSNEIQSTIGESLQNFMSAYECFVQFDKLKNRLLDTVHTEISIAYKNNPLYLERVSWKDYTIKMDVSNDNDGIYFGFTSTKGEQKGVSREPEMVGLYNDILREIGQGYKNTPHYIGWKHPNNIGKHDIELNVLYGLREAEARKKFIDEIINEANQQWDAFKELLLANK